MDKRENQQQQQQEKTSASKDTLPKGHFEERNSVKGDMHGYEQNEHHTDGDKFYSDELNKK